MSEGKRAPITGVTGFGVLYRPQQLLDRARERHDIAHLSSAFGRSRLQFVLHHDHLPRRIQRRHFRDVMGSVQMDRLAPAIGFHGVYVRGRIGIWMPRSPQSRTNSWAPSRTTQNRRICALESGRAVAYVRNGR